MRHKDKPTSSHGQTFPVGVKCFLGCRCLSAKNLNRSRYDGSKLTVENERNSPTPSELKLS